MMHYIPTPVLKAFMGLSFLTFIGGYMLIGFHFGKSLMNLCLFLSVVVWGVTHREMTHRRDCANFPSYAHRMRKEGKFRI